MDILVSLLLFFVVLGSGVWWLRYRWGRGFAQPPPPTQWLPHAQRRNQEAYDQWWASHPHLQRLQTQRYRRGEEYPSVSGDLSDKE